MNKIFNPKIVYPVITVLFIALIGILFFFTARFFTSQISGAFKIDQSKIDANLNKLDMDKYKIIAPRLGIDTSNIE